MSAETIWTVDDVRTKPGQGQAFLKAYREHYVPGAEARGMRLVHAKVEPAMWLDDEPNRLLLVWALDHVGTVWGAKHVARMTPDVDHFWNDIAPPLIEARTRSVMAEADQLEALANV
ncbi:hypothetical protein SAMN06295912_12028 [Sphingomonas laterariae]|uniref:NIPSNAP protein n=1 Tax=Edaphosphingomonas laterariae TaxID=861865 RepID=A0A239I374_9SPHN|nr:hypothetical protein [Sphingomonas laterariae]SNS86794.1 hypothetical protein SAMN06295912_12028 [Sphingomonas laterariae]